MRKHHLAIILLASLAALVACGGNKADDAVKPTASDASPTSAPTPTATPAGELGKPYDCDKFKIALASGWTASPLNLGMVNVLPEGKITPGLYFKFEGDGNASGTAEASIKSMIKTYGGSPMEATIIGGITFMTTTYTYNNMTQTMHVAFRNGTKITITIEGAGAKDDVGIQRTLASVVWK